MIVRRVVGAVCGGAIGVSIVAALTSLLAGCGPMAAKDVGKQLFNDSRIAGSDVNKFSCSTCHVAGDGPATIKAGFDLTEAAHRTRYWGGYATNLLDATNDCLVFFMRGTPMTKDDPKARALYEFLASTSTGPTTQEPMPLSIVENVTTLPKGDPNKGAKVWDNACAICHGAPHTGDGRLTELASLVPDASQEFSKQIGFPAELIVIEKVRHGAFFGVGGTMPPFTTEQLSDDDLGALIAFLDP